MKKLSIRCQIAAEMRHAKRSTAGKGSDSTRTHAEHVVDTTRYQRRSRAGAGRYARLRRAGLVQPQRRS
jgi:hypothetical protein